MSTMIAGSFKDFSRLTSVWDLGEVEARFMFCRLSNRDDVIVILAWSMRNGDDHSMKQTQDEESRFTVSFAGIFRSNRIACKNNFSIYEVNAVFVKVLQTLRLIPCEHAT